MDFPCSFTVNGSLCRRAASCQHFVSFIQVGWVLLHCSPSGCVLVWTSRPTTVRMVHRKYCPLLPTTTHPSPAPGIIQNTCPGTPCTLVSKGGLALPLQTRPLKVRQVSLQNVWSFLHRSLPRLLRIWIAIVFGRRPPTRRRETHLFSPYGSGEIFNKYTAGLFVIASNRKIQDDSSECRSSLFGPSQKFWLLRRAQTACRDICTANPPPLCSRYMPRRSPPTEKSHLFMSEDGNVCSPRSRACSSQSCPVGLERHTRKCAVL